MDSWPCTGQKNLVISHKTWLKKAFRKKDNGIYEKTVNNAEFLIHFATYSSGPLAIALAPIKTKKQLTKLIWSELDSTEQ